MSRIVVYQAVSNGYDKPTPPKGKYPAIDYEIRAGLVDGDQASIWNRRQKILTPPGGCDMSLYLDGNIWPRIEFNEISVFMESWLGVSDIAMFRHPTRKCAYVEIEACVGRGKITHEQADVVQKKLQEIGLPKNYGLWACGVIARRTGVEWIEKMQRRWFELTSLVCRDQLWLPAVAYEMRSSIPATGFLVIEGDIFDNRIFSYRKHA